MANEVLSTGSTELPSLTRAPPQGRAVVLKLKRESGSPRGPVKTGVAGPSPKVSDSVSLKRGLSICISNKFPRDAAAAPAHPHLLGDPTG